MKNKENLEFNITLYIEEVETDCGLFYKACLNDGYDNTRDMSGPLARSHKNAVKFALEQYTENLDKNDRF